MIVRGDIADALASSFEYPRKDSAREVRRAALALPSHHADYGRARDALLALAAYLDAHDLGEAEERYTRLFDLKPVCTLNLAWHIFGDTYDRGALLAHLVPELEAHGIDHRFDLPDYLPTLVRLLGRLEDEEDRQLLAHAVMLPGLEKICRKLNESNDPWSQLLLALPALLTREVPADKASIPRPRKPLEVLPC